MESESLWVPIVLGLLIGFVFPFWVIPALGLIAIGLVLFAVKKHPIHRR